MNFKFLKEFKEFAVKGNMIDIAVGVIIGAAFNKVVDVMVKEVFLPPLALMTDGTSWSNKKIVLREAQTGIDSQDVIAIGYGKLFESTIDFIIIGLTVFVVVKIMNAIRNKADDPKNITTPTPKNLELLDRIGDLMEKQLILMEKNQANTNDTK